ncbi:gamma carbonic anhydrase family protein [Mucisphaera calidilacus]|uniref:2,3,4,5-tetrahydropyridine-2,6-dicarboxylate N-acetyltransferase n=1 Tax=Mucisphaera calidilacus TaxID=2527982 RepID=A0A518BWL2_9BACT|nr:gamma carbonic anhydrase family protein [Mucisphaera calidilacus]QDU71358.1 2,3,4,5-tetrahydropyridine-2,6-dicarboxylate N-acetyltransferase [Mucisphaera calidilacus]
MSLTYKHGVYMADTARVLGDVQVGNDVTFWYGAAVRGDVAPIVIGDRTNVQDNAVIHCDSGIPNIIGSDVVIGHAAMVHGAEVGDGSLIGMQATVLGQARIGKGCLIAAGAVVRPGMEVPDGMVVMGLPGKIVRETTDNEMKYMAWLAKHYVELAQLHATQTDHPRVKPWDGNQDPARTIEHPAPPPLYD